MTYRPPHYVYGCIAVICHQRGSLRAHVVLYPETAPSADPTGKGAADLPLSGSAVHQALSSAGTASDSLAAHGVAASTRSGMHLDPGLGFVCSEVRGQAATSHTSRCFSEAAHWHARLPHSRFFSPAARKAAYGRMRARRE